MEELPTKASLLLAISPDHAPESRDGLMPVSPVSQLLHFAFHLGKCQISALLKTILSGAKMQIIGPLSNLSTNSRGDERLV